MSIHTGGAGNNNGCATNSVRRIRTNEENTGS